MLLIIIKIYITNVQAGEPRINAKMQSFTLSVFQNRIKIQDFYLSHTRLYREYITSSEM